MAEADPQRGRRSGSADGRRLAYVPFPVVAGLAALLASLVASCVPRALPETAFTGGPGAVVEVACCPDLDGPVRITYLGVGGLLVQRGSSALLTAPLFSNPGLLETGLMPFEADPDRIRAHLPDVSGVTAILVGHGHYDHLMDVPWIVENAAPDAVVYGNATTAHQLAPFGLPPLPGGGERVRVVTELAGTLDAPGTWIPVGPGIRVMPLLSDHAPHLAGDVLYHGVRRRDMPERPRAAEEWLDGQTLAYLIDLLGEDGEPVMRIYYQDAVAAAPYGLVPPLGDGKAVDLAVVVPATYAEVMWQPEVILENTRPRHVLLAHWENFFLPPSREQGPVPFTHLPDFVRRLERALPEGVGYEIPRPGTTLVFRRGS